jgi:hypothetical protein
MIRECFAGPGWRRQDRPSCGRLGPGRQAAAWRGGLRKLFDKLGRHGRILALADQPASFGALPVAVARMCGHQIADLPGPVVRRLAELHPGTAKIDVRDAWVIAGAARTLPHTLRRVDAGGPGPGSPASGRSGAVVAVRRAGRAAQGRPARSSPRSPSRRAGLHRHGHPYRHGSAEPTGCAHCRPAFSTHLAAERLRPELNRGSDNMVRIRSRRFTAQT